MNTLEVVDVRVYKLHGTNLIADMYWLGSDVAEYKMNLDDIKNRLKNFVERFVNDYNFKQYLDGAIYNNGALKYILVEHTHENITSDKYKDLTIERIFCQEPNFDVSSYGFKIEDYDYEKNRLGNLCLLESSSNKDNDPPLSKISTYINSSIVEIQNLAGEIQKQQLNFNKNSVDKRREAFIGYCLKRFKIE